MITGWRERVEARADGGHLHFGLDDPRCRDTRLVGVELAALAEMAERAPVPGTDVITAPLAVWQQHLWPRSTTPLLRVTGQAGVPLSIRCRLLMSDEDGPVGPVWQNPVWNNIDPEAVWDGVIELVGIAARQVVGEGAGHRLTFSLQRFVPAVASLLVRVADNGHRIHVRACWGLAEAHADRLYFDHFVLRGSWLVVEHCRIERKHTATVPADGGTHTVDVPPEQVSRPVLSVAAVRSLAACSREWTAGHDGCAELDVVLVGQEFTLLNYRRL
ncbi:hypothetical protein ACFFQW_29165 [Umezawaea endophytica]|uniref:Uncharacterized protein n=1 Tax=Umezawaea endophytica TaxID=1654476 RepID=A0A9X2VWD6_9PSEU|nr:hypothetical protein [Umezawaea endophytica]MCS7484101.1 hypothetical protein [Umezawaea endophytica]